MSTGRRRRPAALVAAAVLTLGGLIAEFTVAASSSDDPPASSPTTSTPVTTVIATASRPRGNGLPAPVRVTLEEAAASTPFTVLAPDPPPPSGGMWVFRSPDDRRFFPQVTIEYLPRGAGQGISLIEGAERGRSPRDGERTVVRAGRAVHVLDGPPQLRRVRTVIAGTDVAVSGQGPTLDDLIYLAASLRPVRP